MRRVALLLILVMGCSTYKGSVRTAQVGAGITGGAFLVGYVMAETRTLDLGSAVLLIAAGYVGVTAMLGGFVGMVAYHDDPDDDEPRKPDLAPGHTWAKRTQVRGMSPEEHARCMETRRQTLLAAQQIDDRKRRGAMIAGIKPCGQLEEVEVQVSADTGETAEEKVGRRERAWAMTKQAGEAARAGDCTTVMNIGREIYRSDPDFHDTVFARDVAIARCVWPAPAATAP